MHPTIPHPLAQLASGHRQLSAGEPSLPGGDAVDVKLDGNAHESFQHFFEAEAEPLPVAKPSGEEDKAANIGELEGVEEKDKASMHIDTDRPSREASPRRYDQGNPIEFAQHDRSRQVPERQTLVKSNERPVISDDPTTSIQAEAPKRGQAVLSLPAKRTAPIASDAAPVTHVVKDSPHPSPLMPETEGPEPRNLTPALAARSARPKSDIQLMPVKEIPFDGAVHARVDHDVKIEKPSVPQTQVETPHRVAPTIEGQRIPQVMTTPPSTDRGIARAETAMHADKRISEKIAGVTLTSKLPLVAPSRPEPAIQQVASLPAATDQVARSTPATQPARHVQPGMDRAEHHPIREQPFATPNQHRVRHAPQTFEQIQMLTAKLPAITRTKGAQASTVQITQFHTQPGMSKSSKSDPFSVLPTDASPVPIPQNGVLPTRAELPVHVAKQLAEALQHMPSRPVDISLNPQELGRVRLSVATSEAGIVVNVLAERPETLEMMRRHIDQLEQEFQALGYQDIAFSFAGAGGDAGQDSNDSPSTHDQENPASHSVKVETQRTQIHLTTGSTTGVDIRL